MGVDEQGRAPLGDLMLRAPSFEVVPTRVFTQMVAEAAEPGGLGACTPSSRHSCPPHSHSF